MSKAPDPAGDAPADVKAIRRATHKTIKKVTEDIDERFHFNTVIASCMELVNALYQFNIRKDDPHSVHAFREAVNSVVLLLAPFAPHICAELWESLGHKDTLENHPWPSFDLELIKAEEMLIILQVNGKVREKITVPAEATEDYVKEYALKQEKVQQFLDGKPPKKVIYVPSKLLNIVA
jgi:leucyl-tRNA synthetase